MHRLWVYKYGNETDIPSQFFSPFGFCFFKTKSTNLIPKLNEEWAGLISCLSTLIKLGE